MRSVLFVCTANICRSPMAEGLLQSLDKGGPDEWRISSAGVWASGHQAASLNAVRVLEQNGVDISDHRSQPVTSSILETHQLILVMEENHKDVLNNVYPQFREKVFLLREMVGDRGDILDPIGLSLDEYESTAQEIYNILEKGFPKIKKLTAENTT